MGILSKPRTSEQIRAALAHAREELLGWQTETGAVEHEIAALLAAGEDAFDCESKLARLHSRIAGQQRRIADLEADHKAAGLTERILEFKRAEQQRAADYQALRQIAADQKALRAEYAPKLRALDAELKRTAGRARQATDDARATIKALAADGLDPATVAQLQGIMQDVSNTAPLTAGLWSFS